MLQSCWRRTGHKRTQFSGSGTFLIKYYLFLSYSLYWHLPFIASQGMPFLGSQHVCLCPSDILSKHMTIHHILVKSLDDTHTAKKSTGSSIWMLQLNNFADTFSGLPSESSQAVCLFCHFSRNRTMCQAARGHKTSSVANKV